MADTSGVGVEINPSQGHAGDGTDGRSGAAAVHGSGFPEDLAGGVASVQTMAPAQAGGCRRRVCREGLDDLGPQPGEGQGPAGPTGPEHPSCDPLGSIRPQDRRPGQGLRRVRRPGQHETPATPDHRKRQSRCALRSDDTEARSGRDSRRQDYGSIPAEDRVNLPLALQRHLQELIPGLAVRAHLADFVPPLLIKPDREADGHAALLGPETPFESTVH